MPTVGGTGLRVGFVVRWMGASFYSTAKLAFTPPTPQTSMLASKIAYGRQNESLGSWMEVEWQVPHSSGHVGLMEVHKRAYPMSPSGNFYLRLKKLPSTLLHKPSFHLLPQRSIPSNEPPVLSLDIWFYGIFHLRPQKLPFILLSNKTVPAPFTLLPPTSFAFQRASSTSIYMSFIFTEPPIYSRNNFYSFSSDHLLSFDDIWTVDGSVLALGAAEALILF